MKPILINDLGKVDFLFYQCALEEISQSRNKDPFWKSPPKKRKGFPLYTEKSCVLSFIEDRILLIGEKVLFT
jgi:hypothetical protein